MANVDPASSIEWTREAEGKFRNIPFFVRTQARQQIEQMARTEELDVVTAELVERARHELGQ